MKDFQFLNFEYCEYLNEQGQKEYCIKGMLNNWHFASFENKKQVKKFFKTFGIKKDKRLIRHRNYKSWAINKNIAEYSFTSKGQLPPQAKQIKALSNGAVVDCYYTTTKNTIEFYRPNPNAKSVYLPLPIEESIKYHKENGIF